MPQTINNSFTPKPILRFVNDILRRLAQLPESTFESPKQLSFGSGPVGWTVGCTSGHQLSDQNGAAESCADFACCSKLPQHQRSTHRVAYTRYLLHSLEFPFHPRMK